MQITAAMVKELRERTGAGMMECKQALVDASGDLEAAVENLRKKGQAKADKKAGRIAAEGVVALATDEAGKRGALVELNCETDFVAKKDEFRSFAQSVASRALAEDARDVGALADLPLGADGGASIEERRRELVMQLGENVSLRRVGVLEASGGRLGAYVHGARIGVLVDVRGGDAELAKDMAMHVAASRPLAVEEADMPPDVLEKEREILLAQVADSGKPPEIQEKMVAGRLRKYLSETTLLGQPFVKNPDVTVKQHLDGAGAGVAGFLRFEVGEGIEKKAESFAEEVMAQVRGQDDGDEDRDG